MTLVDPRTDDAPEVQIIKAALGQAVDKLAEAKCPHCSGRERRSVMTTGHMYLLIGSVTFAFVVLMGSVFK